MSSRSSHTYFFFAPRICKAYLLRNTHISAHACLKKNFCPNSSMTHMPQIHFYICTLICRYCCHSRFCASYKDQTAKIFSKILCGAQFLTFFFYLDCFLSTWMAGRMDRDENGGQIYSGWEKLAKTLSLFDSAQVLSARPVLERRKIIAPQPSDSTSTSPPASRFCHPVGVVWRGAACLQRRKVN